MSISKSKIKDISKKDNCYSISLENSTDFGLEAKYGVEPRIGDLVTLHKVNFSEIRGVSINDKTVFYKTDEQLEQERKDWLENNEKKKQAAFIKNKAEMDSDYNSLPEIFRLRIDKFRNANPRFRVDYESYELFCCKESLLIANAVKTKEMLNEFRELNYEQQKEIVPELSDDHSGNTFGIACRLAYWYLTQPDNVINEHGAIAPLVGCKECGCHHTAGAEIMNLSRGNMKSLANNPELLKENQQ